MPREQINHPALMDQAEYERRRASGPDDPPQGAHGPTNDAAIHVSWLAAEHPAAMAPGVGWVQLGMEADIEQLRFAIEAPNGATSDRTLVYTNTLSLAELDRLIAVLKRARRKAFPTPAG